MSYLLLKSTLDTSDKKLELKTAIISVRHPALMSVSPRHQSRIRHHINYLIERLSISYDRVQILCHDHRDLSFATSFKNVDYLYTESIKDYFKILEQASLLITYRLHSFLPAIAFKTPAINIEYDERSSSLISTAGLSHLSINIFNEINFMSQIEEKLELLKNINSKINQSTESMINSLKQKQTKTLNDYRVLVNDYYHRYNLGSRK